MHPSTARLFGRMAMALQQLGDISGALEFIRRCIVIRERTLGIDHHDTLTAYSNVALWELSKGEGKLAARCLRHVINLREIMFGESHPDECESDVKHAFRLGNSF